MREMDEVTRCSTCGREPVGDDHPNLICPRCDALALNDAARPAEVAPDRASGDDPVYVDGKQCWRRFHQGGWVTMLDADNCRDYPEFCRRNGLPDPAE